MTKKAKCKIIPRLKSWDSTHKQKSKVKVTLAALGTPWPLVNPADLPTIQHK